MVFLRESICSCANQNVVKRLRTAGLIIPAETIDALFLPSVKSKNDLLFLMN